MVNPLAGLARLQLFNRISHSDRRSGTTTQQHWTMSLNASYLRPLTLFLFVFAGYYKASDVFEPVPVDITLLFAVLTVLLCLWTVFKERRLPAGSVLMAGLFVVFLVGLRWPGAFADYPTQKTLRLFSLTALAVFASLVLIKTDREKLVFMVAVACLGTLMAAFALLDMAVYGVIYRASVWNVNPILVARASGFAVVCFLILYWYGRLSVWQVVIPIVIALLGLVLSGSRGPLVAAIFTVCFVALAPKFGSTPGRRALWTLVVAGGGVAACLTWLSDIGISGGRRMVRFLTGEWGDSEATRLAVWKESVAAIADHPFGLGWGRFSETIQVFHGSETLVLYPHNILLEISVEAGWLGGIFFACLVCWVLLSSYKRTSRRGGLSFCIVLAGLVYWLVCAFVSGDINDNRPFWTFLVLALSTVTSHRLGEHAAQQRGLNRPDERSLQH
ncbi:O-antigen ligase family protein [Pelagibius litoralis]|uniref:O-antigen ligase family protein n=1 Tax=Pelagibius litoralis TaxID=374515 RepID=A0A967F0H2_9PROT|nr:O-antigen ligase family protein [Pelagibius litoralis]NIA70750.1 O-antigen ligase family protein [Pelagibius litoralis]